MKDLTFYCCKNKVFFDEVITKQEVDIICTNKSFYGI